MSANHEAIRALKVARERIARLCSAANDFARRLKIMEEGKEKYPVEDWTESITDAIKRLEASV